MCVRGVCGGGWLVGGGAPTTTTTTTPATTTTTNNNNNTSTTTIATTTAMATTTATIALFVMSFVYCMRTSTSLKLVPSGFSVNDANSLADRLWASEASCRQFRVYASWRLLLGLQGSSGLVKLTTLRIVRMRFRASTFPGFQGMLSMSKKGI